MSLAMYAGSFDPITNGHVDIIQRAAALFQRLVVAVAVNPDKTPLFPIEERVEMVKEACTGLKNVEIREMPRGLLVEFAAALGVDVIVRGLRAVSDFDYELQLASMNRSLRPEMETVFFMTGPEHYFLSSSIVKQIARLGGEVSGFVPSHVEKRLCAQFGHDESAQERGNQR
jgi:pantetheine-phosphate adenylyltransferase